MSSSWGGRREGAGRPRKGKGARDTKISFRLSSEEESVLDSIRLDGESINQAARRIVLLGINRDNESRATRWSNISSNDGTCKPYTFADTPDWLDVVGEGDQTEEIVDEIESVCPGAIDDISEMYAKGINVKKDVWLDMLETVSGFYKLGEGNGESSIRRYRDSIMAASRIKIPDLVDSWTDHDGDLYVGKGIRGSDIRDAYFKKMLGFPLSALK